MQIKTLLIACFATGQALGWTIPNGQPDGTYTVHADGNGTLIHEFIVELPTATSATPPQVDIDPDEMDNDVYIRTAAAYTEVQCVGGSLPEWETDEANRGVDAQCQNGCRVGWHRSVYTKVGGVVAYFCNNRDAENVGYAYERQQTSGMISAKCGRYIAGWAYESGSHYTYGYQHADANFCPIP